MALGKITTSIVLDVYDHDLSSSSIKSISCDSGTRYVRVSLTYRGTPYKASTDASATLTVIRPDKTAASVTASVTDSGGLLAELTDTATAIKGSLLGQFKIEDGTQVIRTEVFRIVNGVALDEDADVWADEYKGYNLDEYAAKVDFLMAAIEDISGDGVDVDGAITQNQIYVDHRISVHDNGIYINT